MKMKDMLYLIWKKMRLPHFVEFSGSGVSVPDGGGNATVLKELQIPDGQKWLYIGRVQITTADGGGIQMQSRLTGSIVRRTIYLNTIVEATTVLNGGQTLTFATYRVPSSAPATKVDWHLIGIRLS